MTPRPFLTARWSNVVLLTFAVPEDLVRAHLPRGIEPDRWEGQTHASLVALQMQNMRVHGWRVPGFTAHPQVNLRLYLRHRTHAAVMFVRELVPSRVVAAAARWAFGEPFHVARITSRLEEDTDRISVEYRFGLGATQHRVAVTGTRAATVPAAGTFEHHLVERTHGCRLDRSGQLRAFRVDHVPWAVRTVTSLDYAVDFGALYGAEWAFLSGAGPASSVYAVGSEVCLYPPEK